MADVSRARSTQTHGRMDVLIRLERTEPPAGTVLPPRYTHAADPDALPFVGWLGLLRVLSEIMRAAPDPVAKRG